MIATQRSWADFYSTRLTPAYRENFGRKYRPFINMLAEAAYEAAEHSMVAEFGCGIGTVTHLLCDTDRGSREISCFALDNDPWMLDKAERSLCAFRCQVVRHDIRTPMWIKFDIAYSHGVLEHFDDDTIRKVIGLQKNVAGSLIHCVPSSKYGFQSFGDERLMTPDQWRDICSPDRIETFNDGHEIVLIWNK